MFYLQKNMFYPKILQTLEMEMTKQTETAKQCRQERRE